MVLLTIITPIRLSRRTMVWIAAASIPLGSGCAGPRPTTPPADAAKLSDTAFQSYLQAVDLVTVDEAYRAMLILADGEDTSKTFEERKEKLESRGIARAAWKLEPQNVIDAGSLAYMVCRICQIRGGVCFHLFGANGIGDRRYALRELIYREMVADSVAYQFTTGAALVALLAKADAVMAEKKLYPTEEDIQLTDERDRDAQGNLVVPPAVPPAPAGP